MNSRRKLYGVAFVSAAVIIVDQIAKAIVNESISRGEKIEVLGPLKLTLTFNDGVAFGLAGGGGVLVIALSGLALVALGAFIASAPDRPATWLAGGLILGGALGNLIDRLRLGHVTDFILVPGWPAFNFADASITVGVVLLAWTIIRHDDSGDRSEPAGDRAGQVAGAESRTGADG